MRPHFNCLVLLIAVAAAGCEMEPEAAARPDSDYEKYVKYMPQVNRWDVESQAVNRRWYEVFIQKAIFGEKELAGYYQLCRTYKYLPIKPGEKEMERVAFYVHYVYPPTLEEPLGFFTENGEIYRYIWNDNEKSTPYVASTTHEKALKILLGIPAETPIFIKPASRPEQYIWYQGKFMRK